MANLRGRLKLELERANRLFSCSPSWLRREVVVSRSRHGIRRHVRPHVSGAKLRNILGDRGVEPVLIQSSSAETHPGSMVWVCVPTRV
jgi:hypothetical protein